MENEKKQWSDYSMMFSLIYIKKLYIKDAPATNLHFKFVAGTTHDVDVQVTFHESSHL